LVAAKLGLALATHPAQVTTVWPPSGIALVTLLVLGKRYWPGVFIGALIANALTFEPWGVALGIAVGNTLEAVVAAFVLKRWAGFNNTFVKPADAGFYILVAAGSTVIAALIGSACLLAGGLIAFHEYFHVAITWWQGDFLGDLLFGPLLLVYLTPGVFRTLRGRWLEAGLLMVTTVGMAMFVILLGTPRVGLRYLLFPLLIWAATRFTQLGAVTVALVGSVVAIWGAVSGLGAFAGMGDQNLLLLNLELFLCILSSTGLVLALAIAKRQAAQEALRRQAEKLEQLEGELKEANRRMTNILEGVLDHEDGPRRGRHN
jgi:integral membrane sensor domain MASE1